MSPNGTLLSIAYSQFPFPALSQVAGAAGMAAITPMIPEENHVVEAPHIAAILDVIHPDLAARPAPVGQGGIDVAGYGARVEGAFIPSCCDGAITWLAHKVLADSSAPTRSGIANNFDSLPRRADFFDKFDIKLDYQLSSKMSSFVRISHRKMSNFEPPATPGPSGGDSNAYVCAKAHIGSCRDASQAGSAPKPQHLSPVGSPRQGVSGTGTNTSKSSRTISWLP